MSFLCQCFKLKRVFQMRKLILLNLIAVLLTLREGEMWEVATALWTLVLLAGTIWLVRHFVRPDTAWGYRVIVFIAWFLGFFGAVLLPVDIATAYGAGGPDGAVKGLWLFVYWTTFVLTWVVCPIAQEFFGSGYFTPKARLRDSLRANLKFYIVAGVVVVVIVVWMVIGGVSASDIPDFVVSFANAYGLILIVLLAGHGLVELPRSFWRKVRGTRMMLIGSLDGKRNAHHLTTTPGKHSNAYQTT